MNRRGFLGALSGALAAFGVGATAKEKEFYTGPLATGIKDNGDGTITISERCSFCEKKKIWSTYQQTIGFRFVTNYCEDHYPKNGFSGVVEHGHFWWKPNT